MCIYDLLTPYTHKIYTLITTAIVLGRTNHVTAVYKASLPSESCYLKKDRGKDTSDGNTRKNT